MTFTTRSDPLALFLLAILLTGMTTQQARATSCSASSGPRQATVIELYTSEGCSSCPPADRWLSGFAEPRTTGSRVIPLAFHVDYWNYLGWSDRFSNAAFTARQHLHAKANQSSYVYTPQTVIAGRDSTRWRQAPAPGVLTDALPATASGAKLAMTLDSSGKGVYSIRLKVESLADNASQQVASGEHVAYLALYENRLTSTVKAGENAGRKMNHDFVVRDWRGPYALNASGTTRIDEVFNRTDVVAANAGWVAIVENRSSGKLLDALALPHCRTL